MIKVPVAATVVTCWILAGARGEDYVHEPVQYQNQPKEDGTYSFGYDTGLFGAHSLHYQYRDEDGVVHGRYAYTDPSGNLRSVEYTAGPDGYRVKGDVGPEGMPKAEVPARRTPSEDVILAAADTSFERSRHFHPNRELKGTPYRRETFAHVHMENNERPMVMLPKDPVLLDMRLEDQYLEHGDILRERRPIPYKRPLMNIHPNADIKGSPVLVHREVRPYVDVHPNSDIKGSPVLVHREVRPYVDVHPNADIKGAPILVYPKGRILPVGVNPNIPRLHNDFHLNADIKGAPVVMPPKGRPHIDIHPNAEIKGAPVVMPPKGRPHIDVHPNAEIKGAPVVMPPKGRPHIDVHPNAELKSTPIVMPLRRRPHIDVHPNAELKGTPVVIPPKGRPHIDVHPNAELKGTPIVMPPKGRPHIDVHPNAEIKGATVVMPPKGRPHIDIHPNAELKGTSIVMPPKGRTHIDVHPNAEIKGAPIVMTPKGRPHIDVHPNADIKGAPVMMHKERPHMDAPLPTKFKGTPFPISEKRRPHIDVHPNVDIKGSPAFIPPKGDPHVHIVSPAVVVKGASRSFDDHLDISIRQKHVHIPPHPVAVHSTKGVVEVKSHVDVPAKKHVHIQKAPIVPVILKKHHHDRSEMTVEEEVIYPGGIKGSRFIAPPPHLVKSIHEHSAELIAPDHHHHKTETRQDRMLGRQLQISSSGEEPRPHVHSNVNVHRDVQVLSSPGRVLPSRNGSHVHVHFDSKTNKTVVHIHRDPPTRGPHVHVHRDPVTRELFYHQHADPDPLRPHFHNESAHPEHADHSPEGHVHQHRDPADNHTYLHLHGDAAGLMHDHPGDRHRVVENIGNLVVTTVRDGTGRMVSRHIHPAGEHAHRSGHYQPDHGHTAEYGPDFRQQVQRMDNEERLERALHRTSHSDYRHHQGQYVYGVSLHDGRLAARRVSQDDDEPADHLIA